MKQLLSVLFSIILSAACLNAQQNTFSFSNQPSVVSPEISGSEVTFRLAADYTTTVRLCGSWLDEPVPMRKSEGVWSVTVALPDPGQQASTTLGLSEVDASAKYASPDHAMARSLCEEIVPFISSSYRVNAKPAFRILSGQSSDKGVMREVRAGYPNVFGSVKSRMLTMWMSGLGRGASSTPLLPDCSNRETV